MVRKPLRSASIMKTLTYDGKRPVLETPNSTGPEQIRYPSEAKQDKVEYVLEKYLNGEMHYRAIFKKLDDRRLERILREIKEKP